MVWLSSMMSAQRSAASCIIDIKPEPVGSLGLVAPATKFRLKVMAATGLAVARRQIATPNPRHARDNHTWRDINLSSCLSRDSPFRLSLKPIQAAERAAGT